MAKTKVSSTELVWIFHERLQELDDCSPGTYVAIVPSKGGWEVVTNPGRRRKYPLCVKRIEKIQTELRELYVLAKD